MVFGLVLLIVTHAFKLSLAVIVEVEDHMVHGSELESYLSFDGNSSAVASNVVQSFISLQSDAGDAYVRQWDEELAPATLETMSIVLPCAFEGNFAVKTVDAIWARTNTSRIKEIIVVDDGSTPPLRGEFPDDYFSGRPNMPPIVLVRNEQTRGLISAKKSGGDHAVGDIIVFLDCHISPREGWEEAMLHKMNAYNDHRTVVVPVITSLDPDTWQEIDAAATPRGMGCYFTWNADFTWLTLMPDNAVPIMSGGLLAMSRQWWQESGGYDSQMKAWGGENIDQSIRTWLCGGRIELVPNAFIAHMWRVSSNPKTRLKYPMPTEAVMRNKARAVRAWFGPFAEKTWTFPEYGMFARGEQQIGSMEEYDVVKQKLQCKPFTSFLDRFSFIYKESGFLPEEVFQLREEKSGLCLQRDANDLVSDVFDVSLETCTGVATSSGSVTSAGKVAELQLWHVASRNPNDNRCCSGLSNWNFNRCLTADGIGLSAAAVECDIAGATLSQHFALNQMSNQLMWKDGEACASVRHGPVGASRYAPENKSTAKHEAAMNVNFARVGEYTAPATFRLRSSIWQSMPSGACVAAGRPPAGDQSPGRLLQFERCVDNEPSQLLHATPFLAGFQIKIGSSNLCLDAVGGQQLLAYPCYEESNQNFNQVWYLSPSGSLCWHGSADHCVEPADEPKRRTEQPSLVTCSSKSGQIFLKDTTLSGLQEGEFGLRDPFSNQCLGGSHPVDGNVDTRLALFECGPDHVWTVMKNSEQVRHVKLNMCIDRGVDHPILYLCHPNHAEASQRWQYDETPGWLRTVEGWGDNGRKRSFEQCLDLAPAEPSRMVLSTCDSTLKQNVRWTKIGIQKPMERKIWEKANAEDHRS
eukprot:TRINITY_DN9546_c1_g3_i2.p1 TRINITY_DN9546_c1_g3~~TRINITY_DN9546_c1_g3_i2.p1  ORF type:complete len:864 (-),score=120.04 TRINITY_DN9546_c1_g3_i2:153-2744(-)